MALQAESLTRRYGQIVALNEVSVTVNPSAILAVMGPSGSGKSTLIRLMACLEEPTAGSILLEDAVVSSPAAASAIWPAVTVVFQQLFLWPHLTLKANVLLPLRKHPRSDRERSLERAIELFDMAEFIDRYPNEVSGGQRQRAALARAFVVNPRYILLDEVTSALDLEQQDVLSGHLRELRRAQLGVLIVTHSLGFAESCADRAVCLRDGMVAAEGPASDLAASDSLIRQSLVQR